MNKHLNDFKAYIITFFFAMFFECLMTGELLDSPGSLRKTIAAIIGLSSIIWFILAIIFMVISDVKKDEEN